MASIGQSPKASPNWPRHKQGIIDPLDQVGYVSKGDTKLLDTKAQESYYKKIVDRYMQFCSVYAKDLDAAFASLPKNPSDDPTRNPPVPGPILPAPASPQSQKSSDKPAGSPGAKSLPSPKPPVRSVDPAAKELSILLLSLRKLREAILATGSKTTINFSQRVHIFCVRTSILAQHPPSYYPPLERLLKHLHTSSNPLSASELHEFTTYLILDYACRQGDLEAAYELRARSRDRFGFQNSLIDRVLMALMHDNWVLFWKAKQDADGYTRCLMEWAVDLVRRRALKAIGKAYLTADVKYVLDCCAGQNEGWTWEKLVEKEGLGWKKEGNKVIIKMRRPIVAG
ncbi:hypothetical protein AJ80_02624 [Polytolypa hystricis UAMH7299]|uniref:CSN8/PSMD8/EIF3K domain-containing protein n=1 Tax=Polytolypa hystricis (strain UAMH7299) TaxID=1447883 RepID=A0A2B7YQP8_POLH7|nr:hypothetical protein AJ80_02624 [Polytolypa hystricis UAMH7299]